MTDDPERLLRRLVDHHRRGERITDEEHNDARLWVMSLLLDNLVATQKNSDLIKSSTLDAETVEDLKTLLKALDAKAITDLKKLATNIEAYALVGGGVKHFLLWIVAIGGAIIFIRTFVGDWIRGTLEK